MPGQIDITRFIFSRAELSVAFSIQELFGQLATNYCSLGDDFNLPAISELDLSDQFHKKLYHTVLKPYSERAKGSYISAFFAAYSEEDFKRLKTYQSLFYQALKTVKRDLSPLNTSDNSSNYKLQVHLINHCLYSALVDMNMALPWHREARSLFHEAAKFSDFRYNQAPICVTPDGRLQVISTEGRLLATIDRAERAEASNLISSRAAEAAQAQVDRIEAALRLRAEARPEARPEPRPEARPEPRPEARPEPRPEARPEARPEPRPEARPEPRPAAATHRPWYAMFRRAATHEGRVLPEPRVAHN